MIRSALFCWLWLCSAQAAESPAVVFQIGAADGDYREFAIAGKHRDYPKRFPLDVDYVVGRSRPEKDWPYILPGPVDAWAGGKSHAFKIHFQIPRPGPGYYQLALDLVSTHESQPPLLAIEVNGERLEYQAGAGGSDQALTDPRAGKKSSIRQLLPSGLFRAGENTIVISTAGGCWALFDDVRLESGLPAPKQTLSVTAEPLPMFKRSADGPKRAVKLSVTNLEAGAATAQLGWKAKGRSGSQQLSLHFGKNDFQVGVPDVNRVELTLRAAGQEIKLPLSLPPARKWRVFVVPTTHTDVGYTDLQDRVKVRHAENGLLASKWLKEDPTFKWYWETYWQLDALLELHPEQAEDVFARLREKRMGLSGAYANMLTGLCSTEAFNRLTLDSWNLARRGGFEVNSAILDDVPSAVGSLPIALSHAGIKYFIEGVNNDRAPYAVEGWPNRRPAPGGESDGKNQARATTGGLPGPVFYWEGADGSRVLSHIWRGYAVANRLLHTVQQGVDRLPAYLAQFDKPFYPYDAVLINGAYSDNRDAQAWLLETVRQWNAEWEYPKVIFALPEDFFGYLEKNFAKKIPTLKTDFGGWWEDGAGSSALETTLSRRAEERLVTAEMLHSLDHLLSGAAYPKTNFDAGWRSVLLYNEHTWGAAGSIREPKAEQTVKQWEVKSGFARQADSESRALLASGLAGLAAMTPASDLVVFNQLSWPRKAVVTTEDAGAVLDAETKQLHPCQPLPEGGSCFIAENLPAIGYRSYRQAVLSQPAPNAVQISGDQMENEFYRVTFNPKTGGIQSIYDKQIKRELVDAGSEHTLGELVYVTGGEGSYAVRSDLARLPAPRFEYHRQTGTGIKQTVGPVFGELASEATATNFPKITLRARLYHGLKQLDLIYELDKQETTSKEAVYLAFPFAVDAAKGGLWLEYPDAITEPLRDQHPTACRDWYSVQRWLALSDGQATVEVSPLDAPLFTIGRMGASTWPRRLEFKRGHIFAYLMNNYWHTNYKAEQGGRFVFRYSLTSSAGGFSKQDAVVKGWDLFCPPVAGRGRGAGQALLPAAAGSLVDVAPAGLPLTAIKQAEDRNGLVFRLCDLAGKGGKASVTLPRPAGAWFNCNLAETDLGKLGDRGKTATVPVKRFGLVTLKARLSE